MEKKLIAIAIILALAGGCNMPSVPEAKKQAYDRWYETRANVLCQLGRDFFETGNLKKAKAKINEALSLDEDNREDRVLLAKIYIEQEAYQLATAELTKLQEDCPRSPEVPYLLGVAQEKSGLLDDALVSYRQCQSLDQSNISAVIAAAEVLASQGKVRQAQLYVDSYIGIADNDPGMYELAGRLAMMRGEYDKAAEYCQRAHDLDLENVPYTESLARAQFLSGKFRLASETLKSLTGLEDYETPSASTLPCSWDTRCCETVRSSSR
jgi:Tfp pilus assembly protein PilF